MSRTDRKKDKVKELDTSWGLTFISTENVPTTCASDKHSSAQTSGWHHRLSHGAITIAFYDWLRLFALKSRLLDDLTSTTPAELGLVPLM